MRIVSRALARAALPLILITLWQGLCLWGPWSRYLLPAPAAVLAAMWEMLRTGELIRHILLSFRRVLCGYALAAVSGVLLGVWGALFPRPARFFSPLERFVRAIPPLGLSPLLMLWLGIGEGAKIAVIFLSAFFPILSAAGAGVAGCSAQLREVGRAFGFTRRACVWYIILPASRPAVAAGLCLGLSFAWRAIVGAEMIAASGGLGYLVLDAQTMARTDKTVAGILVIGLLGLGLDALLRRAQRRFVAGAAKG